MVCDRLSSSISHTECSQYTHEIDKIHCARDIDRNPMKMLQNQKLSNKTFWFPCVDWPNNLIECHEARF